APTSSRLPIFTLSGPTCSLELNAVVLTLQAMVLLYLGFSLASKVFLKTWNVFSAVVVLTEEERKWFYSEENPWVAAERSDISLLGTSRLQLEEGEIDVIGYGCSSIFCERGSQ